MLKGGFAPNIILLKEFDYKKAGIILEGLHFSAWILLGHIRARHNTLLRFMQDPENHGESWPEAFWPENYQPKNEQEWIAEIAVFEEELNEMVQLVQHPETDLFKIQANGKTISWAAMAAIHHTGYHIGQLKTIGRQLGVW